MLIEQSKQKIDVRGEVERGAGDGVLHAARSSTYQGSDWSPSSRFGLRMTV